MPKYSLHLLLILASLLPLSAQAAHWDLDLAGGLQVDWLNIVSLGVAVRTEKRDPSLVGKLDLDVNHDLCAPDDCLTLSSSRTDANDRYLAAPGAMAAISDDGNLNFDQWDIISAPLLWDSHLDVWGSNWSVHLGALFYYDHTNNTLQQYHPNEIVTPGPGPGVPVYRDMSDAYKDDLGLNIKLQEAYIDYSLPIGEDRYLDLRLGRQVYQWGNALVGISGTLNFINPADLNRAFQPGAQLKHVFLPVNMLSASMAITESLTLKGFYQLEWRSIGLPPRGSYLSFLDAGSKPFPNEGLTLPFSKAPNDPFQLGTPAHPLLALFSSTSFTALRIDNHEPSDMGQYGINLAYVADSLGQYGTRFGLYYANYHSRIPSVGVITPDASCARREGNPFNNDATNLVDLLVDCGVDLNATTIPSAVNAVLGALNTPSGTPPQRITTRDLLPLETTRYFLDYPEDIHLYGASFSTTVWNTIIQGELTYRPNQPVQVDLEDVLFAAFQPLFPRQTIQITDTPVTPGSAAVTLADSEVAIPNFLEAYRGLTPGEMPPNSYLRGYERLHIWKPTLDILKILGEGNFLGSDTLAILLEVSAEYIDDLPPITKLQFEGPGTNTSAGPGIADTGNGLLLNPITNGFDHYVTDFSWGYRLAILGTYNDWLLPGLTLRPFIVLTHDVSGVSAGVGENFLEGRKILVMSAFLGYGPYGLNVAQTIFSGGGDYNTLHDRNFFSLALSYQF